jgi:hypothetical protein
VHFVPVERFGASFTSRFIALFLSCLLLPVTSFADDPWDKPPAKWNLADTYRILEDSPWSPVKSKLQVNYSYSGPVTPPPLAPVTPSQTAPQRGEIVGLGISKEKPVPVVNVLWWSSKTVRLAHQRMRELLDKSVPQTLSPADALTEIVIRVEDVETFRILRDSAVDPRESAYLAIAGGTELDPSSVDFHERDSSISSDLTYVDFHFPRDLNGHPTVTPDDDEVVFRCKAAAKKQAPNRPNQVSIRVVFNPVKMRVAGQPDF